MAITERIGFETADAIANLNALNSAILQVNNSMLLLNRTAARGRGTAAAATGFSTVAKNANQAKASVGGAANALQNAGKVGTQAGQSLTISWETFARVLATQAIVRTINAISDALGEASERAAEFEISTARIANITNEGVEGIDSLRQSIRDLAITTGRDLGEVTEAALEALQNDLGNTQETFELLTGAADDLAKATGVDLTSSVNTISSVIKAYNVDASEAARIADELFVAYDKGRITLSELESRMGTVIPQTATLGVTSADAAAAVASLTLSGLNSQTAMTQLRNVLAKLIKPTDQLKEAFEVLGVESGNELVQEFGGLQGALEALRDAFGGNEQAVAKAFGTIRGQLGVLNFLANEGTNFTNVLEAMDDSLGRVRDAADTVNDTTTQQINEEYQLLLDNTLGVGNAINQLKLDTLTFINDFISGLQNLRQRQDFQSLITAVDNFGTAFISVIDDIIAKLDEYLRTLANVANSTISLLQRITDPVGAAEETRIDTIREDMIRLGNDAESTAQRIRDAFAQRADAGILGDQSEVFDNLRRLEAEARVASTKFRAQFLANEARIRANTEAADAFRRSVVAATAPSLFGGTQELQQANAEFRAISDTLNQLQQQSATADVEEAQRLQRLLDIQRNKIQEKADEVGIDSKAVQALIGQANATEQILQNQEQKIFNEFKAQEAIELANQSLQRQRQLAIDAGVAFEDLGLSASNAGDAIEAIPDPQVNASAAIAQMNALRAAAIQAAQAVRAASSGGGFYHGGFVHRAEGGSIGRGQDNIPALLSPGEFVVNRRSTGRFFSQLQAMNAGQSPAFRETGGSVTQVGDINVNVSSGDLGGNPSQTARDIATGIRRELRRKSSRLS